MRDLRVDVGELLWTDVGTIRDIWVAEVGVDERLEVEAVASRGFSLVVGLRVWCLSFLGSIVSCPRQEYWAA
jgi:hypothetical protein